MEVNKTGRLEPKTFQWLRPVLREEQGQYQGYKPCTLKLKMPAPLKKPTRDCEMLWLLWDGISPVLL